MTKFGLQGTSNSLTDAKSISPQSNETLTKALDSNSSNPSPLSFGLLPEPPRHLWPDTSTVKSGGHLALLFALPLVVRVALVVSNPHSSTKASKASTRAQAIKDLLQPTWISSISAASLTSFRSNRTSLSASSCIFLRVASSSFSASLSRCFACRESSSNLRARSMASDTCRSEAAV